eukprot:g2301.t1
MDEKKDEDMDVAEDKYVASGFHVWVAGEVPPGVELRIHVAKLLRAVEKDSVLQEYKNMLISTVPVVWEAAIAIATSWASTSWASVINFFPGNPKPEVEGMPGTGDMLETAEETPEETEETVETPEETEESVGMPEEAEESVGMPAPPAALRGPAWMRYSIL